MNNWVLKTRGDPLETVGRFIGRVWEAAGLDAMILPPTDSAGEPVVGQPHDLGRLNPFQPLMLMNTAGLLPGLLQKRSKDRLGILLRPCEWRALNELSARGAIRTDRLLTICADCLGTFPKDEYDWRLKRKGSAQGLSREALQFAPQGGISAYRYRAACQICTSAGAGGADLNIGIFGLPVRQSVLVQARNGKLDLGALTDGPADPDLVARREHVLARLDERHARTRERVLSGLAEVMPADVEALLDQFEACGGCQICLQACPICTVEFPRRGQGGRYERQDVIKWLASCAGCGMCEQACPDHRPLALIFSHVRRKLKELLPEPAGGRVQ
jgi:formate dehydrogenase subunit beta